MAKHTITHSCGHTQEHQLLGPSRDRDRKAQWLADTLCSDCYRAERDQQRAAAAVEAAAQAVEQGMPPLGGTEKQIAWAERIRGEWLQQVETGDYTMPLRAHPDLANAGREFLRQQRRQEFSEELRDQLALHLRGLLYEWTAEQTRAGWWIDNRDIVTGRPADLIPRAVCERAWAIVRAALAGEDPTAAAQATAVQAAAKQEEDQHLAEAARAEATLRPEAPTSPLVAEFTVRDGMIQARFPERDDRFRAVMHRMRFRWANGAWERTLGTAFAHLTADRAVETAHRLLAKGFNVRLWDPDLRARVLAADYTPDTGRELSTRDGLFLLRWGRDDDLYAAAKRLPGARWQDGAMRVPADAWAEVLDFAAVHRCAVSNGATRLADEQRAALAAALPVTVPAAVPVGTDERPTLDPSEPVEVPAGLLDD